MNCCIWVGKFEELGLLYVHLGILDLKSWIVVIFILNDLGVEMREGLGSAWR